MKNNETCVLCGKHDCCRWCGGCDEHCVRTSKCKWPSRAGFTVVELMFVVVVIAIILAMLVPAGMSVVETSRKSATKATIVKIEGFLYHRQDRFEKDMLRNDGWFKRTHRKDFEPWNTDHIVAKKHRFNQIFMVDEPIQSTADSSEVLYAIVTQHNPDAATYFRGTEVGDTDGDGKLEFLDGWGRPLRYYPHASRIFRPGGGQIDETAAKVIYGERLPADVEIDRDDPAGLMRTEKYLDRFGHDANHHPILVVSAGPSGNLGLYEPHDAVNNGRLAEPIPGRTDDLYDNVSNLDLRK